MIINKTDNRKRFNFYGGFCERCGCYFTRLGRNNSKICINCYNGNHNLLEIYTIEDVLEFIEGNIEFIDYKIDGEKVYKVKNRNTITNIKQKEGQSPSHHKSV